MCPVPREIQTQAQPAEALQRPHSRHEDCEHVRKRGQIHLTDGMAEILASRGSNASKYNEIVELCDRHQMIDALPHASVNDSKLKKTKTFANIAKVNQSVFELLIVSLKAVLFNSTVLRTSQTTQIFEYHLKDVY